MCCWCTAYPSSPPSPAPTSPSLTSTARRCESSSPATRSYPTGMHLSFRDADSHPRSPTRTTGICMSCSRLSFPKPGPSRRQMPQRFARHFRLIHCRTARKRRNRSSGPRRPAQLGVTTATKMKKMRTRTTRLSRSVLSSSRAPSSNNFVPSLLPCAFDVHFCLFCFLYLPMVKKATHADDNPNYDQDRQTNDYKLPHSWLHAQKFAF
mmetsp:Transcript_55761/g.131649  ORF Transcript_55761/g.131649 Transcript_55761/m.131649 type:complete len:208 (-) Transcript_55761:245-868(-)